VRAVSLPAPLFRAAGECAGADFAAFISRVPVSMSGTLNYYIT
jgi:hypothetical protein